MNQEVISNQHGAEPVSSDMADKDLDDSASADADAEIAEKPPAADQGPQVRVVFDLEGKQIAGSEGSLVRVTLPRNSETGPESTLRLDQVRLARGERTVVGRPHIEGAYVELSLKHSKPRKIKVMSFKKRRRKHSSATLRGHVERFLTYRLANIHVPGLTDSPQSVDAVTASAE